MGPIKAHLLNTKLKDRTLWYDGDSSFNVNTLTQSLQRYDVKYVDELNDLVREYNQHVAAQQELKVKNHSNQLCYQWTIPEQYKNLNVFEYLVKAHTVLMDDKPEAELEQRERRLCAEIIQYRKYGLDDVLRAVIWIINTLTANNVVWGVGRGSSVSSYVLYVIGVHDVDSFAYNLDLDDFLHE